MVLPEDEVDPDEPEPDPEPEPDVELFDVSFGVSFADDVFVSVVVLPLSERSASRAEPKLPAERLSVL